MKRTLSGALLAAASLLLLTAWKPHPPPGVAALVSRTFELTGTCTGLDMVYSWSVNGRPPGDGKPPAPGALGPSFIYPWEESDITIRAVEIFMVPPAPGSVVPKFTFLMSGNNAGKGDTMLFLDPSHTHGLHDFPAGTGFQFPGKSDMTPLTYIDLHGSCTAGMPANIMYTLYYTLP